MARRHLATFFAGLLFTFGVIESNGACADPLEEGIHALEPVIGHYPADLKDKPQVYEVIARYGALKRDFDKAISAHPGDEKLLFERGVLQSMGHNFEYRGAWAGATRDLTEVLKRDPDNVAALLALGDLWVNSRRVFAAKAEKLFLAAQCHRGDVPLEEAQRGLFFALSMQGKIREATSQAQYLHRTWPDNQAYAAYVEFGRMDLDKRGEPAPEPPTEIPTATCANSPHWPGARILARNVKG
jgi:tetratricopeptide (TPR) repeat protein